MKVTKKKRLTKKKGYRLIKGGGNGVVTSRNYEKSKLLYPYRPRK